jgi:hypothetical protein
VCASAAARQPTCYQIIAATNCCSQL